MKNDLENIEYINELLDLYKNLLTKKQVEIGEKYYVYNLSLSEISEELDVTRSSISDTLKQTRDKLYKYEKSLNLQKKYAKVQDLLEKNSIDEEIKKEIIEVLYGI